MALKKLDDTQLDTILTQFNNGESPSNLAEKYGVHPTTVRRYLRERGRDPLRMSHQILIDTQTKLQLRKLIQGFTHVSPDLLISELDKHFLIKLRDSEDKDFPIINV